MKLINNVVLVSGVQHSDFIHTYTHTHMHTYTHIHTSHTYTQIHIHIHTACLGLVHGDDPQRCYGEGGGRGFMFGNTCKN